MKYIEESRTSRKKKFLAEFVDTTNGNEHTWKPINMPDSSLIRSHSTKSRPITYPLESPMHKMQKGENQVWDRIRLVDPLQPNQLRSSQMRNAAYHSGSRHNYETIIYLNSTLLGRTLTCVDLCLISISRK